MGKDYLNTRFVCWRHCRNSEQCFFPFCTT